MLDDTRQLLPLVGTAMGEAMLDAADMLDCRSNPLPSANFPAAEVPAYNYIGHNYFPAAEVPDYGYGRYSYSRPSANFHAAKVPAKVVMAITTSLQPRSLP